MKALYRYAEKGILFLASNTLEGELRGLNERAWEGDNGTSIFAGIAPCKNVC